MELPNKIELDNLESLKTVNQYRNAVNINKIKILSFYGNLETKRFLLHILLKAQINWTINSSIFGKFRSVFNAVAFWENNQSEDVSKLNEVQLNEKLLEREPHLIENPCVVEEMPLAEFTDLEKLSDADHRIIRKLRRLDEAEIAQLKQYADAKNPIAQLLMYFIAMDNDKKIDAKNYLKACAHHYPLANFFILRNTLYGNVRCDIEKDTTDAIEGIDLLSQLEGFYTVLCTLLLCYARYRRVISAEQLNERLITLVQIIKDDIDRKSFECTIPEGTGPDIKKLSQQIIFRYEKLLIQSEEAKANSPSSDQEKVESKGSLNRFTP